MSRSVRLLLLAVLATCMLVLPAAAAHASFGPESWFAANCKVSTCEKAAKPEEELAKAKAEGYSQAAGHPPFGVTDFKLKRVEIPQLVHGQFAPEGNLKNLRVDVAPGVSTSPEAVAKCSVKAFTSTLAEPKKGLYLAPECAEVGPESSLIGENIVKTVVPIENETTPPFKEGEFADVEFKGKVYNLEQTTGLASLFGVAIEIVPGVLYAHTFIEGNVEWGKEEQGTNEGDYHDYFVIKNITPGLLESRLIFNGNIGTGGFLTNPSSCVGPGPHTTTHWRGESYEGATALAAYTTPIGAENCGSVPFSPTFSLKAAAKQFDQPNGITTELEIPHNPNPAELDSSQLKAASVQMPEGMTLNPSAAAGLTACTPAQARIHSATSGVACPTSSQLGTVKLEVPQLPAGSLTGNVYLGGPESGPITGPPYIVYLDAESARYGVSVRIKGEAFPNLATGQVTTYFTENPEQPFTNAILHFKEGALAPIANPLVCGTATTLTTLTPFSGTAAKSPSSSFTVDSNGLGGACSTPPPFSLSQSTQSTNPNAGGHTFFTFNLARSDGQQYLGQVRTVLPAGLEGAVPQVTQCAEALANAGTCPVSSQIGTAVVQAGAGATPFTFSGPVYFTGPYNGAPFGMSIAVPAIAGPFNLGNVVTRAMINVDPYTGRVIATAVLPRIVGGVPIRVKNISVTVSKSNFLYNPTSCGALATESTLSGYTLVNGAITGTQLLSTPFSVGQCSRLQFKPSFNATSNAKTSKANGASLETTIKQAAGQANIRSVKVQLPIQLPSRLTTLQQACLAATFEANPFNCPKGSFVGGVRANTPLLPAKMTGPAILVSHANAAFPDLDLVLQANGVRVILVGNTDIKKGITTTTFAATPDAPVSSATVNLPIGPHSALAAFGNLCAKSLLLPTTIVGWNGTTTKQNTKILVRGCPVKILRHRVRGNAAFVTVQTFAAGRVSGGGGGLATVFRRLRGPATITLRVPLSRSGQNRGRPFSTRLRVGFVPSSHREHASISFARVAFF
jgi:hypothetical protein